VLTGAADAGREALTVQDLCAICEGEIDAPGGVIWKSQRWVVDHCIGPLGVGTLIVKPVKHRTSVGQLTLEEAAELGPVLQRTTEVVQRLTGVEQVYVTLWSHADWRAQHIHFVIQPIWNDLRERHPKPGPALQSEMFNENVELDRRGAAIFAGHARAAMSVQ
jgi:diadenosine tetraphosphate (Ap4A) HIT family hydrolase